MKKYINSVHVYLQALHRCKHRSIADPFLHVLLLCFVVVFWHLFLPLSLPFLIFFSFLCLYSFLVFFERFFFFCFLFSLLCVFLGVFL